MIGYKVDSILSLTLSVISVSQDKLIIIEYPLLLFFAFESDSLFKFNSKYTDESNNVP